MLGSGSWAIEIYHRRVQKSKLSCPAPRYRTATMHEQARAAAGSRAKCDSQAKTTLRGGYCLAPAAGLEPAA